MLDAVLALLVLVTGVFLITSSYVDVPQPEQVGLLSNDLLDFMSSNKIRNLNNQYAGIGGELWTTGHITDADNTLLQQAGLFYATGKNDIAAKFIQNVSAGIVPAQFNFEMWINGVVIYPSPQTSQHIISKNATKLLLTSKKITFGVMNESTGKLWGPYKAEVFLWEK